MLVRKFLPRYLTVPRPLFPDRIKRHDELSFGLSDQQKAKRAATQAKTAATKKRKQDEKAAAAGIPADSTQNAQAGGSEILPVGINTGTVTTVPERTKRKRTKKVGATNSISVAPSVELDKTSGDVGQSTAVPNPKRRKRASDRVVATGSTVANRYLTNVGGTNGVEQDISAPIASGSRLIDH